MASNEATGTTREGTALDARRFGQRGALTLHKGTRSQQHAAALAAYAEGDAQGYAEGEYRVRLWAHGFALWVREWRKVDTTWHRTRMGETGSAQASAYHVLPHGANDGERTRCIGHGTGDVCPRTAPNAADDVHRVLYAGDKRYTGKPMAKATATRHARTNVAAMLRDLAQHGATVADAKATPGIAAAGKALALDVAHAMATGEYRKA